MAGERSITASRGRSICVYCGRTEAEGHSPRCSVSKFGEKAIYDIAWREEAERLRNVAGKLQDENDRLHHDLLELREKHDACIDRIGELSAENDALRTRAAA